MQNRTKTKRRQARSEDDAEVSRRMERDQWTYIFALAAAFLELTPCDFKPSLVKRNKMAASSFVRLVGDDDACRIYDIIDALDHKRIWICLYCYKGCDWLQPVI